MPIAIVTIVPTNPKTRPIIRSATAIAPRNPHQWQVTRVQVLGMIWSCRLKECLQECQTGFSNGDPGGSRTPNPQIRSLMLYPIELRGRPPEAASRSTGGVDSTPQAALESSCQRKFASRCTIKTLHQNLPSKRMPFMPNPVTHTSSRLLEFETLRDLLAGYASSPLGQRRICLLYTSPSPRD